MTGRWRRLGIVASVAVCAAALAQPACAIQDAVRRDAYASYAAGDYDAAIRGLQQLADAEPSNARVRRTLVAALLEVGRYDDAERAARASNSPELATALGEVLLLRGRLDEAQAAFQRAVQGRASDANTARLNLSIVEAERGRRDTALDGFDAFIDVYNNAERLTAKDLLAVAEAVRRLGVRDHQLFQDAMKALDEALKADDGNIDGVPVAHEAKVRMGFLYLEKYNSSEAQPLFREVLEQNPKHPGALLGMAMAKNFDGSDESMELVRQSLEANPHNVAALTFRARLLLDLEQPEQAKAEIDKALAQNPRSLEALSTRAAMEFLLDDTRAFNATRDEVLRLNPAYADLFNQVAELAVRLRRYSGAVDLATEAVRIDPQSWWGWGIMGLNQLRTGATQEAKRNLDVSFEGDPYNPWIKNTLDLLDTFGDYTTVKTARFELMLHKSEADLIGPALGELAEEAYDKLAARYRISPTPPIKIEVYPRHADFSVRTVGLAGLGALGVCFGNVLALDAPSARERGQFNFGSTLWHEVTHTITLGVSRHRVPRWLTEGLSVLEERRARPGWGDDLVPQFIAAYERGDVLPVSRLSQGFVRPKYPEQVVFSYYQASLVAEMIEQQRGFDALLGMLRAYGDGKLDAQVFRDVLGEDIEAFDRRFEDWFKQKYASQLDAIDAPRERDGPVGRILGARIGPPRDGDFIQQLERGRELVGEEKDDEAKPYLVRARDLFPQYAGPSSPYHLLAGIALRANDTTAAVQALQSIVAINESDYDANSELSKLLEARGDARGAAAALDRAFWIWPYEATLHQKLASLHTAAGDKMGVVRARRALVALNPVDRAEALYQLAEAYVDAGDNAAARREVVRALEIAPNFEKAQDLLLRLRSSRAPEPRP